MPQIAIIADDLTGAADTVAAFARRGLVTIVALGDDPPPPADVLVISTDSRHLPPNDAAARVRVAATRVGEATWIYKKLDSTLRGPLATELAALLDACGMRRALVAPAFPAQGRTTVGGRQLVDGTPLERTPFGREVATSDLVALLQDVVPGQDVQLVDLGMVRRGSTAIREVLRLVDRGIVVADGESDTDLDAVIRAVVADGGWLLSGSAGLAQALTRTLPLTATVPPPGQFQAIGHAPVLVVAGSRHPRTSRQIEVLERRGEPILRPSQAFLSGARSPDKEVRTLLTPLRQGRDAVLTTAGLDDVPGGARAVAGWLADLVRVTLAQAEVGGLVLTGGDVATAVCTALRATGLWLQGEVEPGVPWGFLLGDTHPGLPAVTKAGGFGSDETLALAVDHLRARWEA